MSGVKGKSGRKKVPSKQIQEYLESNISRLPELLEALTNKALIKISVVCPKCGERYEIPGAGDKEAAIYIIDRHLGRPHQSQDLRVQTKILFTPDDYELATRVARLEEQKLIEQYSTARENGTPDIVVHKEGSQDAL